MRKPPWYGLSEPDYIPRIRLLFSSKLPVQMQLLRASWDGLREGTSDSLEAAARAFRVAHDLSGTAEAFGGEELGETSARLATALRPYREEAAAPGADDVRKIESLVAELEAAATEFLSWVEWEEDDAETS